MNICLQRLRAVQEPPAQEAELLLEDLERLGVLELLDLALGRLERLADLRGSARDRRVRRSRRRPSGSRFSAHG